MKKYWAFVVAMVAGLLAVPAFAQDAPLSIVVGPRHGHATPNKAGCAHLGAGNIIVAQPAPDTVILTMTGVAVATAHPFKNSVASYHFDLNQELKVCFHDTKLHGAKLFLEARVIGLLRSEGHCHSKRCTTGSANQGQACAALSCNGAPVASVCVEPHGVGGGENLSINCQEGPVCVPITPGCYQLHQVFNIVASHPKSVLPCKAASAEFAPDALDPLWISAWEPFYGANKGEFGFQVVIRIVPLAEGEVVPAVPADVVPVPAPGAAPLVPAPAGTIQTVPVSARN